MEEDRKILYGLLQSFNGDEEEQREIVVHLKRSAVVQKDEVRTTNSLEPSPHGNGVMDSALACCAGGPGLIPDIGIVELQYSDDFSPSPV